MNYVILLIPNVITEPDVVDPENITQKEQDAMDDYQARLDNYISFETVLNQWTLTGVYQEVIDYQKAPVWEKSDERYNLFLLRNKRMAVGNVVAFVNRQRNDMNAAGLDFEVVIDNAHRDWLNNNDYTPVGGEEI